MGAAWILSKEDFLSDYDFINMLKFKASYGVLGNSGVLDGTVANYYPGYNQYSINNLNGNISSVCGSCIWIDPWWYFLSEFK